MDAKENVKKKTEKAKKNNTKQKKGNEEVKNNTKHDCVTSCRANSEQKQDTQERMLRMKIK